MLRRWDALAPGIRWALLWLTLAAVLGGTWPYFEGLLDANERPRLLAGIGLIEAGSVAVDGPWADGIAVGPDVARAADGRLVPNKVLILSQYKTLLSGGDEAMSARLRAITYS